VPPSRTSRTAVLGLIVGALAAGGPAVAAPAQAAPADGRVTEVHHHDGIAVLEPGTVQEVESPAHQYAGHQPFSSADPYRSGDHDPTLIGITPGTGVPAQATISEPQPFRADRVTVTGTGFEPGERVTATLPSLNRGQLGTAVADGEGTVSIRGTVPVQLPAGDQEVLLRGTSGETANTSFEVRSLLEELRDRLIGWGTATDAHTR